MSSDRDTGIGCLSLCIAGGVALMCVGWLEPEGRPMALGAGLVTFGILWIFLIGGMKRLVELGDDPPNNEPKDPPELHLVD